MNDTDPFSYPLETTFIGGPAHGMRLFVADQTSLEADAGDGSGRVVRYLRHEVQIEGHLRTVYALSTLNQAELDQAVLALYGWRAP